MHFTKLITLLFVSLFTIGTNACLRVNVKYHNSGQMFATFIDNGVHMCSKDVSANAFNDEVGDGYKAANLYCSMHPTCMGFNPVGSYKRATGKVYMNTNKGVDVQKKFWGLYERCGETFQFMLHWTDENKFVHDGEYTLSADLYGC